MPKTDVARIIELWPKLSEAQRKLILALMVMLQSAETEFQRELAALPDDVDMAMAELRRKLQLHARQRRVGHKSPLDRARQMLQELDIPIEHADKTSLEIHRGEERWCIRVIGGVAGHGNQLVLEPIPATVGGGRRGPFVMRADLMVALRAWRSGS